MPTTPAVHGRCGVSGYPRAMAVARLSVADLDWAVDLLRERRGPLVSHAPIFWRPAPDARAKHREFLEFLLTDGKARGYRTANAILIAAPRGDGWLVDDAFVPDRADRFDGRELWNAFASDCGGAAVRFVCPTYEAARAAYAVAAGLTVQETWWLKELSSFGGAVGLEVDIHGVRATTVDAPPVYAPGGPMLFLPVVDAASPAITAMTARGEELGCAGVVVNQSAGDEQLTAALREAGLRPHCSYFAGTVAKMRT